MGIYIDNKLDFDEHISKIYKKVSLKLHALSRISHFLSTDKLRTVMKAFIESQFEYCPIIWMFHSRTLNNRINRLHKRALRLAYKDSKSTFEELLDLDKSFTIHHRNLQKLVTKIFKVKNNLSPRFMKSVFPDSLNPNNLEAQRHGHLYMRTSKTLNPYLNSKQKSNCGNQRDARAEYVRFI